MNFVSFDEAENRALGQARKKCASLRRGDQNALAAARAKCRHACDGRSSSSSVVFFIVVIVIVVTYSFAPDHIDILTTQTARAI